MDTPSLNEEDIHTIIGNMIKKNAYESLGECIASDQVAPHKMALYFKDKDFLRWYQKKNIGKKNSIRRNYKTN